MFNIPRHGGTRKSNIAKISFLNIFNGSAISL
jgi:hypothetical protein